MNLETLDINVLRNLSVGCLAGGFAGTVTVMGTQRRGAIAKAIDRHIAQLDQKLRRTSYQVTGKQLAIAQALGALVTLAASATLPFWSAPVALLIIALAPNHVLERGRKKRVAEIESQIDSFLTKLSNAVRVTPSVGDALRWVEQVLEGPIREEVERTNREMRLGSPLDAALLATSDRVGSPVLAAAITAILIGRRVGGDLARNLESMAGSLREMSRLEGVLRSKTAEGRAQLWVLAAVPLVLSFILDMVSSGYFKPLLDSFTGAIVLGVAVILWISSLLVARKVLSVEL